MNASVIRPKAAQQTFGRGFGVEMFEWEEENWMEGGHGASIYTVDAKVSHRTNKSIL